jgi:2-amino-4-hydroxy-6-hydroxymethyldihydropteridine diphosphokinase
VPEAVEGGTVDSVYLALGSNAGDRAAHLSDAVRGLRGILEVDGVSSVYETDPFGVLEQPVFWNMAVAGRTRLEPEALLAAVKALEQRIGRTATYRMGPREIDIDVLLHGSRALTTETLTVPHPGLSERAFVLQPLLELEPGLVHPVTGERLSGRLAALGSRGVRRLGAAADVLGSSLAVT